MSQTAVYEKSRTFPLKTDKEGEVIQNVLWPSGPLEIRYTSKGTKRLLKIPSGAPFGIGQMICRYVLLPSGIISLGFIWGNSKKRNADVCWLVCTKFGYQPQNEPSLHVETVETRHLIPMELSWFEDDVVHLWEKQLPIYREMKAERRMRKKEAANEKKLQREQKKAERIAERKTQQESQPPEKRPKTTILDMLVH